MSSNLLLMTKQPASAEEPITPSYLIIEPEPVKKESKSSSSSNASSGARRRTLRRRRSQIVRNSLQETFPLLPASALFPNLPRAQPGLMPTRGGGQKSVESKRFAAAEICRAKTVFFYRDGDNYFTQGVRVPVSKNRFRTMDALMDSLNDQIPLPFGVRRLHTPTGRTTIRSLDELQPQGRYIAASGTSNRRVRGVDLEAVERRKRLREDAQRRWNFQQQPSAPAAISTGRVSRSAAGQSFSSSTKSDEQQQTAGQSGANKQLILGGRLRSRHGEYPAEGDGNIAGGSRSNPFMPVTSKQIYFVLNGHPHRVYRALVNPLRRGDLDGILEEVSEGLQAAIFRLYSFEGDRVLNMEQLLQLKDMRAIAVPRHERLALNGMIQSDILRIPRPQQQTGGTASSLPPIGKTSSKNSSKSSSSGSTKFRQPSNNIDRLPAYDDPSGHLNLANEAANRRKRSRSPLHNDHLPKNAFLGSNGQNEADSMRHRAFSNSLPHANGRGKTATNEATGSTSNTTADSDSGRPRSAMEMELTSGGAGHDGDEAPIYEEDDKLQDNDEIHDASAEEDDDKEDDDDYPVEPPELQAMHPKPKRKPTPGAHIIDEEEEEEEEEHGQDNEEYAVPKSREDKAVQTPERGNEDEQSVPKKPSSESMQIEVIHSDEFGQPIVGQYSEELEHILYGQAATKIQSAWRGYAVRKELKRTRFAEYPTYINDDSSARRAKNTNNSFYKPNERHQAIVSRVKTPMPMPGGSVLKKKSSSMLEPAEHGNETMGDSASDREEANVTELLQAKRSLGWEMAEPEKSPTLSRRSRTPKNGYLYTVTVITGNRWAADTEADLFVVLHSADSSSEKFWLRQEFTNWLQSGPNGQRFRQNQSDSFTFTAPARLGILKKITIGHEHRGYGAGIFIDRVLVTEDEEEDEDCRQFLFLCNKWFDSGQVDGKLERTIRLNAFFEICSIPVDNRVTRGRWELILHSGTEKGQGGTTSQLSITGYGTRGQSTTGGLYDSAMAKVPSESLMQVDFGDIGELLKIRIEIDGSGANPDYFLNFVEFKDLDTEERFVLMCGKWLRWASKRKGDQPFRELFAFHIGVEPLPLIIYEGKIRVISPRIDCLESREIKVELHGDLGETGFFRVELAPTIGNNKEEETKEEDEENGGGGQEMNGENSEKIDIPFKVEAVSVGRVIGARLKFAPNELGQEIVEGLMALQGLFQKQGLWPLASNSEFLISRILLRESAHTPYRYILTRSQFQELSYGQQQEESFYTKELLTTEMEGISTRQPKRKEAVKANPNWLLQMSLDSGSSLLPEVVLCGENGVVRMQPFDTMPSDGMLSYQPEDSNISIGTLRKIRIFTDGEKHLTGVELDRTTEEESPFTLVQKIRLCDTANGEELRFPAADCQLQRHSVFEMSTIWPDRPPIPIVIYLVRIVAGNAYSQTPALRVRLNLNGELGDVGWRTLSTEELEQRQQQQQQSDHQPMALFAPKTRNSFEFEAVSIGEIEWAELEVECEQADSHWECKEMVITDTNTALFYTFKFERPFTAECRLQRCSTLPFTNAL